MSLISKARAPMVVVHALAGDLLMMVPTLRAIGQRYGFDLTLVCGTEPEHALLLRSVGFTHIYQTLFKTREPLPGELIVVPCDWGFDVEEILPLAQSCDLLVFVTDSPGPAFDELARLSKLPSIGPHAQADRLVSFDEMEGHTFDRFFTLAKTLCGPDEILGNHAWFPHRNDAVSIRRYVRDAVGPRRLLALHADTKPNKMWPIEYWATWLQRLWQCEPQTQVLLLGYPAIPAEHFAIDSRLHDLRDLPLTVSYEIAAMADQFIGIDSCILHAADLCRVPSIGIFGSEYSPALYGLRFSDGEVLLGGSPPCDVSIEAVWEAYARVRNRQKFGEKLEHEPAFMQTQDAIASV